MDKTPWQVNVYDLPIIYTRAEIGFDLKFCKLDIAKICAEEKNYRKMHFSR